MMKYSEFVKFHYDKTRHLEPKERFKALAKMWHDYKAEQGVPHKMKGGVMSAGVLSGAGMKKKAPK